MSTAHRRTAALVLCGCGTHDGTEPTEFALASLALEQAGFGLVCAAPAGPQGVVVDHQAAARVGMQRDARTESARLTRGPVRALEELDARAFDLLVLPGGWGVLHTLCDHASKGRAMQVHAGLGKLLVNAAEHRRPVLALCAGVVPVARVLGPRRVRVTLGHDLALATDAEAWGARVQRCDAGEPCVDRELRVVSAPAFLAPGGVSAVWTGIERAVRAAAGLV